MLKQSYEVFNPDLPHDTGGSVIWSHRRERDMEPWEIRANNKAIVLCGVAMPFGFSLCKGNELSPKWLKQLREYWT